MRESDWSSDVCSSDLVSAVGFALFVAASALVPALSGWVALVFAGVSLYVFWSLVRVAGREKGVVGYSLAWGQGAVTLMLCACAVLSVKEWLGL
jgi:hypothetical protein